MTVFRSQIVLPEALAGVSAFVFDLDGVLYLKDAPIPGAAEAVETLKDAGHPLRFLTNTTSRSRRLIAKTLTTMGIAAEANEVFCPAHAASQQLRKTGESAYLLVQDGALEDFEGVEQEPGCPDAVVVGDLGHDWSFDLLNKAFRCIHDRGARLVGLGRTRYWEAEDGLRLDAGPFISALEYAANVEALVFGKPEPAIFEAVLDDLALEPEQAAMVGDDIQSDIRAAMDVGMRGVLVRTGKFRGRDLELGIEPDVILDSVADLVGG